MKISHKKLDVKGVRISAEADGREIGRAFLFILHNDIRNKRFGYFEDLFVEEEYRKKGIGKNIIDDMVNLAKENNCYKIVGTSRYGRDRVHEIYEKIGFTDFGKEFKMYL